MRESSDNAGENNPMFGRHHTPESREKVSATRTKRMMEGAYAEWFDKGYVETEKGGGVGYRSSWERAAVEKLDKEERVVSFEYEPLRIPYRRGGSFRFYIPDLLVRYYDGRKVLVEIKPDALVSHGQNLAKFAAARKYCAENDMLFEVWTEKSHPFLTE